MVAIGYTMMTERAGPRERVDQVVGAERAGVDFSVTSNHCFPWLDTQGHAPYAWSVLVAAAHPKPASPRYCLPCGNSGPTEEGEWLR